MPMSDPRWQIRGAERDTGRDQVITIQAPDETEAVKRAGRRGLLVESAKLIIEPPAALPAKIPDYSGISFGASVVRWLAAFYLIAAILLAVGWIVASREPSGDLNPFAGVALAVKITSISGLVVVSAVLFMIAGVADAVRDMARNSFRDRA